MEDDDGVRMRVEVDTWRGWASGRALVITRGDRSVGTAAPTDAGRAGCDRACGIGRCRGMGQGSVLTSPVLEEQGAVTCGAAGRRRRRTAPAAELELSTVWVVLRRTICAKSPGCERGVRARVDH